MSRLKQFGIKYGIAVTAGLAWIGVNVYCPPCNLKHFYNRAVQTESLMGFRDLQSFSTLEEISERHRDCLKVKPESECNSIQVKETVLLIAQHEGLTKEAYAAREDYNLRLVGLFGGLFALQAGIFGLLNRVFKRRSERKAAAEAVENLLQETEKRLEEARVRIVQHNSLIHEPGGDS